MAEVKPDTGGNGGGHHEPLPVEDQKIGEGLLAGHQTGTSDGSFSYEDGRSYKPSSEDIEDAEAGPGKYSDRTELGEHSATSPSGTVKVDFDKLEQFHRRLGAALKELDASFLREQLTNSAGDATGSVGGGVEVQPGLYFNSARNMRTRFDGNDPQSLPGRYATAIESLNYSFAQVQNALKRAIQNYEDGDEKVSIKASSLVSLFEGSDGGGGATGNAADAVDQIDGLEGWTHEESTGDGGGSQEPWGTGSQMGGESAGAADDQGGGESSGASGGEESPGDTEESSGAEESPGDEESPGSST